MKRNSPTPAARGIVRLDFRDAKTMEIKRTVEQENALTMSFAQSVLQAQDGSGQLPSASNYSATGEWIYMSDRVSSDGLQTARMSMTHGTKIRGTINQQEWTFNNGSPDFSEKVNRFNPPVSPFTINTIYLASDNNVWAAAIASLNTPCVQTPSEIVDITYRIQWFYPTQDPTELIFSSSLGEAIARKATTLGDDGGWPHTVCSWMWCATPPVDYYGLLGESGGAIRAETADHIVRKKFFKNEYNLDETITTNIGSVVRTLGYGAEAPSSGWFNNTQKDRTTVWAPIAPASFPNKPIQTIHNHAAAAVEWGLDVDFLSTGQGSLTVDGSSWTDPDYPQFYRIDHTLSGQVGVSRYAFRKRPTIGFNGNSYLCNDRAFLFNHKKSSPNYGGEIYETFTGSHGFDGFYELEEYDQETIISWDSTGITINNLNDCHCVNFDPTTTPPMAVTSGVRQVAVDSSKNIWVAAGSGGLFKITDPFGSPTVTKMTIATNTLPVGGENNCYGVAVGFGGDVLAVVEGGLIRTTNPTGATPLFVAETFSFTGVSDNNWANVLYMRSDPDSPDHETALIAEITGTTQTVVWWSTVQTGIVGPVSGSYTVTATGANRSKYGRVRCSSRGSFWARHGPASKFDNHQLLTFGTTLNYDITLNAGNNDVPFFWYDYYDTPYVCGSASADRFGPYSPVNDKFFGAMSPSSNNWQSFQGGHLSFETGGGNGLFIAHYFGADTAGENNATPMQVVSVQPKTTEYLDPLNGQHSPMEEFVWNRYHWNGASWELNYFADATDTGTHASAPNPGDRHNFDTESHFFTGRSMIDITSAMFAGNFAASANATFVFTLIPEAKLSTANNDDSSQQEKPRTVLDISDDTQQFQIVWDDDIQGNITIVEDGTPTIIAATSANSSTYRLVVTVAGTAVTVYLDGNTTPIGTATLGAAFDWDNGDGKLKAFLGCQMYKWDYPQRNSTWESNFYRGEMKNVQLWNVAWNTTDLTNDFGDITSVIVSQAAANLVARYELTQSLATLETKLSHASVDALDDGITIAMVDGGAPTAFIGGDYHTFGVVDGIFKDNAIAFTQQFSIYFKPTDLSFTTFKNNIGTSVINASTVVVTDEKAIFTDLNQRSLDYPINQFGGGQIFQYTDVIPGQLFQNEALTFNVINNRGAVTVQPITGDGYFEAGATHGDDACTIGLTSVPGGTRSCTNIDFGIRFKLDGTVDIVEANVVVSAAAGTYVPGTDTFRIQRIGTAITYHKVVAGTPALLFTSGNTSTGTVYGCVQTPEEGYGVRDAIITYTRPAHILTVGDSTGFTGFFDPDFLMVETLTPESISINIGGSPATVVVSETYYDNMAAPGPGEVVVNGDIGWLLFNSGDVGSAITGEVTVIFEKV